LVEKKFKTDQNMNGAKIFVEIAKQTHLAKCLLKDGMMDLVEQQILKAKRRKFKG